MALTQKGREREGITSSVRLDEHVTVGAQLAEDFLALLVLQVELDRPLSLPEALQIGRRHLQ